MDDQQEREPMQGLADYLRFNASLADTLPAGDGNKLRAWAAEVEAARRCAAAPQTAPPPDAFTVNFVRLAGLDKHKARECEAIVRQMLAAAPPRRASTARKSSASVG